MRRIRLSIAVVVVMAVMMALVGGVASAQTYYGWCGYDSSGYYSCY